MIVSAVLLQATGVLGVGSQAFHDEAAARIASSMHGRLRAERSEVVESHSPAKPGARPPGWRTPTDEQLRRRSGYPTPRGYRFHRSVRVDLDHDGRTDIVEMVERPGSTALRVSYGGGGPTLVANVRVGRWTDQGLFAAGADAVMVNFPESSPYFMYQQRGQLRISYAGD